MYKKIMITTDGSETADEATRRGMDLARAVGASVTLFTVASPKKAKKLLERVSADYADYGVPIEQLADVGDPASAILDVSEAIGTDLIVVGNKGMSGARRLFLSAVPNKISHHANCAVLVVKTT